MSPGGLFAGSGRTVGTGPRNASRSRRVAAGHPPGRHGSRGSAHSLRLDRKRTPPGAAGKSGSVPPIGPMDPLESPACPCYAPRPVVRRPAPPPEDRDRPCPHAQRRPRRPSRPAPLEALPIPSTAPTTAQLALGLPGLAPIELPSLAIAPEWKDQQRLWGHRLHPDVLVPGQLPGRPRPCLHRPLLPPRRRRPRPVQRAWDDPAPGLRRGPDRRRQRPQPVRPPADGRQGRARLRGRDAGPADRRSGCAGPARPTRGFGSRSRCSARPARKGRACRRPGAGSDRATTSAAAEPVPVEVALSFHPRTFAQLLFVRSALRLDDRVDRFLAAAITGILHGKSATYLSEVMPNTFSMAPRYVREFVARTGFRVAGARRLRLPRGQARPAPSRAAPAGPRDRPARRCPRRRRPGAGRPPRTGPAGSGPAGRHLAALPAGREVRLLQLAPHLVPRVRRRRDRRGARRRPPQDGLPAVPPRRRSTASGRPSPRTRSSCWSSATSRPTAAGGSPTASALAEAVWEASAAPAGYRLAGIALDDVHAGRKMTKLWGDEAGQATKLDRILVLGASRGRAPPGRQRGRPAGRLGVAASAPACRVGFRPWSGCTTPASSPPWTRWSS